MTTGWLPQRGGLPGLNGGGTREWSTWVSSITAKLFCNTNKIKVVYSTWKLLTTAPHDCVSQTHWTQRMITDVYHTQALSQTHKRNAKKDNQLTTYKVKRHSLHRSATRSKTPSDNTVVKVPGHCPTDLWLVREFSSMRRQPCVSPPTDSTFSTSPRVASPSTSLCSLHTSYDDGDKLTLRPMSDTQQSQATLSCNSVAQQSCPGNCQFSIGKQLPNKYGF